MSKILTVITPTLNVAKTLPQTLSSVMAVDQACPGAIEHIIVDGGSTDGTKQRIIDHASGVDSSRKLVFLNQNGEGISNALNLALSKATGTYVCVLNADDRWHPEVMVEVIRTLDHASAPCRIYYADVIQYDPKTDRHFTCHASIEPIHKYMSLYHTALFIPLKVHAELGNYDATYRLAMDCEIVHRCLSQNIRFERIAKTVGTMQLRGRSHEHTLDAMAEFEHSVVQHGLLARVPARLYRLRQTIFHTLHRKAWFQYIWSRFSRRAKAVHNARAITER